MKKLLLSLGAIASVAAPVAAVVACGTTPAAKHVDEGFNNASLIENFNMADEAETFKKIDDYTLDEKKYDVTSATELKSFLNDWSKSVNADKGIMDYLKGIAPSLTSIKVVLNGDEITVAMLDASDQNVANLLPSPKRTTIEKFGEDMGGVHGVLNISAYQKVWVSAHKFAAGETTTTVPAVKNDSIDAILYSQANKISDAEKTDRDRVMIAGTSSYKRATGLDFDLISYDGTKVMAQEPLAAEFNKRDKIKFIFDNATDIASFTQRVKFIDTFIPGYKATDKLSAASSNVSFKTIKKTSGSGYEVVGYKGDDIMFSLEATKKNVITLEFKDFLKPGYDQDGVFLGLSGFIDSNKDGVVNHDDESMTNQFIIGYGRLSSSKFALLHKDTFIYGNVDASEVK